MSVRGIGRRSMPGRGLFLPSGHLTEEGVALSVDALKLERYDELPKEIRTHLEDCQECRGNVSGVFALLADQKYAKDQSHPYFDSRSTLNFSMWYKIAAVLVLVFGVGALVSIYLSNRQTSLLPPDQASSSVHSPQAGKGSPVASNTGGEDRGRSLASRLEPNSEMEAFVNARMRSTGVSILKPVNGARISGPILFDWRGGLAGQSTITIYTNTRDRVFSLNVDRTPLEIDRPLQTGLYYWKLECNDELLYFGKFIVK